MNCALALRMLDAWQDQELDAATAAEFVEHLASCSACAGLRDQRIALRAALRADGLRADGLREGAPPGLRQSILRTIAASDLPPSRGRSLPWWQALVMAGGTAVFGALGGWWFALPHLLESLPEIAVTRHVASLAPEGPRIDVASSDRHVVRPWFQGRLDFAPEVRDLSAQGFMLLGARLDRLGDRQAVAVVYRLHGHVINVFSWRGATDRAEPASEAIVRGFNVVTWTERDLRFAAVSDTDRAELARFATAYRGP